MGWKDILKDRTEQRKIRSSMQLNSRMDTLVRDIFSLSQDVINAFKNAFDVDTQGFDQAVMNRMGSGRFIQHGVKADISYMQSKFKRIDDEARSIRSELRRDSNDRVAQEDLRKVEKYFAKFNNFNRLEEFIALVIKIQSGKNVEIALTSDTIRIR